MNPSTQFLDRKAATEVNALREREYGNAQGFVVDTSTLRWKEADDQSYVMAVSDGTRLLATMRGEILEDATLLERKLECAWRPPAFPVLLLSRAATDNAFRGAGLNLLLRYWFLRLARHHGIPYVVGTFVTESPRERSLREMGYDFYENPTGWTQSTYRSQRPVRIVSLSMEKKGAEAIAYCEGRGAAAIEKFPISGDLPGFKVVKIL